MVLVSLESKKPALIPLLLYCAWLAVATAANAIERIRCLTPFIGKVNWLNISFLLEGRKGLQNNLQIEPEAIGLSVSDVQLLALFR